MPVIDIDKYAKTNNTDFAKALNWFFIRESYGFGVVYRKWLISDDTVIVVPWSEGRPSMAGDDTEFEVQFHSDDEVPMDSPLQEAVTHAEHELLRRIRIGLPIQKAKKRLESAYDAFDDTINQVFSPMTKKVPTPRRYSFKVGDSIEIGGVSMSVDSISGDAVTFTCVGTESSNRVFDTRKHQWTIRSALGMYMSQTRKDMEGFQLLGAMNPTKEDLEAREILVNAKREELRAAAKVISDLDAAIYQETDR